MLFNYRLSTDYRWLKMLLILIRSNEMPAKSKSQRRLMSIAEHHPEKLYKKNKGVAKMSKEQLSHYADTIEKGLPRKVKKK